MWGGRWLMIDMEFHLSVYRASSPSDIKRKPPTHPSFFVATFPSSQMPLTRTEWPHESFVSNKYHRIPKWTIFVVKFYLHLVYSNFLSFTRPHVTNSCCCRPSYKTGMTDSHSQLSWKYVQTLCLFYCPPPFPSSFLDVEPLHLLHVVEWETRQN